MTELDKGKPVSLQELMVPTLGMTDALAKLLYRERRHHGRGVQTDILRDNYANLLRRFEI